MAQNKMMTLGINSYVLELGRQMRLDPTKVNEHLSRLKSKVLFVVRISLKVANWPTLLFIPLLTALDAFIKDRHWFIRTADLDLHKVGLVVIASRTDGHGSIDIFPRSSSSKNIIHHFSWRKGLFGNHGRDHARVGTGGTKEVATGRRCFRLFRVSNLQECSIQRTEPHTACLIPRYSTLSTNNNCVDNGYGDLF
jgi:hypothetical protein